MNSPAPDTPIVYVVDDEPAVRDALGLLLQSVGLDWIAFPDARSLLAQPLARSAACLVTDLRMPLMSGIELVESLRQQGNSMPAVIISAHGDIKQAVRALKCGATDFLEKPFDDQDLLDAVHAALKSSGSASPPGSATPQRAAISPRETEVLRLVCNGSANKVIARELGISARTVEVHRAHIMQKLGASSVAELVRMAMLGGYLDGEPPDPVRNHRGINR